MALKYRFGYDIDGFYSGQVRADSNGIFPSNCSEVEPEWKDGFKPKINFISGCWELVKKSDISIVRNENELVRKFTLDLRTRNKAIECYYADILSANENIYRKIDVNHKQVVASDDANSLRYIELQKNLISVLALQKDLIEQVKEIRVTALQSKVMLNDFQIERQTSLLNRVRLAFLYLFHILK